MKQTKIVKKMYEACLSNDKQTQKKLLQTELEKIFERRANGKTKFNPKWVVTDL